MWPAARMNRFEHTVCGGLFYGRPFWTLLSIKKIMLHMIIDGRKTEGIKSRNQNGDERIVEDDLSWDELLFHRVHGIYL